MTGFTVKSQPGSGLSRVLGTGFGIAATLGGIIGLGILRTPGEIATVLSSPWWFTALWLGAGLFALLSVSVIAELVSMNERSGGYYIWIRRAYGPYPGFIIGWVDLLSFLATLALKAVVLGEYLVLLWPAFAGHKLLLALSLASLFAGLQWAGVRLGGRIQQWAAAGIALVVLGFSLVLILGETPATENVAPAPATTGLAAWGLVLSAVVFTYDGWLSAAYFGGEIRGGGAAVARACIRGVALVLGLYLLLMMALAFSVPLASLAGSDLALADALRLAGSPVAAGTVTLAAVLILAAHLNLNYMQSSRILHALASDGYSARQAATIGQRGNPLVATGIAWLTTVVLICSGSFNTLLNLCAFFFVVLYLAMLIGLLILRRREPDSPRPYRAFGHPWSTALCIAGWLAISLFQAWSAPDTIAWALLMIAISWPIWRALEHRARPVR